MGRMKLSHLMRITYQTDATDDELEYQGSFSYSFPTPGEGLQIGGQIVAVDWSVRGQVEVTWLIRGRSPREGGGG